MNVKALSGAASLLLVAAVLVTPATAQAEVGTPAAAQAEVGPLEREDQASAVALARQAGQPVEITGWRTETDEHFANPDGTFTFKEYLAPVRVRRGAQWVPVDTTLRRQADGSVAPQASVLPLRFSGGGAGALVTIGSVGRSLSLSWLGQLPEPVLAADTATYPEVLPGVDLRLRAQANGFAEELVVKNPAAAANPALRRITFGTRTEGLTLQARSGWQADAIDPSGAPVFVSPPSYMWDSPADPTVTRSAQMPVEVGPDSLSVVPDTTMLTGQGLSFPLIIDPGFAGPTDKWTHVNSGSPNTSYWGLHRDSMRVGREYGSSTNTWRTFVRFGIDPIRGKQIIEAKVFSWLDHSASCTPTSLEIWHTGFVSPNSPATTWSNSAGNWLTNLDTVAGNANEEGDNCAVQPDVQLEFASPALTAAVAGMASGTFGIMTFGMKAVVENDQTKWKRFYPGDNSSKPTFLSVIWNDKPGVPVNPRVLDQCGDFCASPAVVRSGEPNITATVSDPNNDAMWVGFEVFDDTQATMVANHTVYPGASGTSPPWKISPVLPDARYHFRVLACDAWSCSPAYSAWSTFTVDTAPPPAPSVNSTLYKPKTTGTWNGSTSTPGVFNLSAGGSTDVYKYEWRWLNGAISSVVVPTPGATVPVTLTPPGDLEQTLQVRAVDKAGSVNTSGWVSYAFNVKPDPVDKAYWKFDEGSGTNAAAAAGGTDYNGVLTNGAAWASGINGGAVSLDGTNDFVLMPTTVNTTHPSGFSISAWVRMGSTATSRTAVAQDGLNQALFRLHYDQGANAGAGGWCFSVRSGDSSSAAVQPACSAYPVATNQWVNLVGVYDPNAGSPRLRLYVNGGPNNGETVPGTVTDVAAPAAWTTTGSFTVGRAKTGAANAPGEWWHGQVDEVRAYQRVLPENEIRQTFQSCLYASCPPIS